MTGEDPAPAPWVCTGPRLAANPGYRRLHGDRRRRSGQGDRLAQPATRFRGEPLSRLLMALEMIDELAGWNLRPPLLTADAGYGQVAEFRQGLNDRGIAYIVATTSSTTAQPGDAEPVEVAYAGVG